MQNSPTFIRVRLERSAGALLASAAVCFGPATTNAAVVFQESGGIVVIEGEHFDNRAQATDDAHHYIIIPDEATPDVMASSSGQIKNARGGRYVTVQPVTAQNRNTTDLQAAGPYIDYKVQISTMGEYQLYLRDEGFSGASDSLYASVVELKTSNGGTGPDWYRYAPNPDSGDFSLIYNFPFDATTPAGWTGNGNPEVNNGGDAGDDAKVVWTVTKAGTYTIRVQQREDGNSLDALIFQLSSKPVPSNPGPPESPLVSGFLIGTQPTDQAVKPGSPATFTVTAVVPAGTAVTYQWQSANPGTNSFSNITGATNASYTTPVTTLAMNGTTYRAVLTSGGTNLTSTVATLITDATPPAIVGAVGGSDLQSVTIRFSKKVSQTSAETLSNYTNGTLTLSNPKLQANGTDVVLTTTAQSGGTNYTITVKNIQDTVGNVLTNGQANFAGAVFTMGGVFQKFFQNVANLAALRSDPRYPNSPTFTTVEPEMEYPPYPSNEGGSTYGNTLSGWLVPPATGAYVFFVCSDDQSDLFLSTDDNPTNKKLIAQETVYSNPRQWQASAGVSDLSAKRSDQFAGSQWTPANAITLTAGKRYYIEVQHVEGTGGDNVEVAWMKPGDAEPVDLDPPIPAQYVGILADPSATITFTLQPTNTTVQANTPLTLAVKFTAVSAFGTNATIQWQRAPSGSTTFTNVVGATNANYLIPFVSPNDNGASYRAVVTASSTKVNSAVATLTVTTDTTPPAVASVNGTATAVYINFSKPLDPASAANKANYSVSGGVTVNGATLTSASGAAGAVQLDVSGATAGTTYNLTVTGVKDTANNTIVPGTNSFLALNIYANFNDAQTPSGATLNGSANTKPSGSYDGSPYLELTTHAGSLNGSIVLPAANTAPIAKFTAMWKMFMGEGSGNAADGVSFCIAPEITDTSNFSEEGTGSGIIIEFDTYNNANDCTGVPEAPAISVKYGGPSECPINDPTSPGNLVVRTPPTLAKATLVNNRWVDVAVQVTSDGKVTLIYDNVKYFDNVVIPGWTPLDAASRAAFGGRTGGEYEDNWIDNIAILYNADIPLASPPTIALTSPTNGQTFAAGANITATVNVTTPGSSVTKVTYYANGAKLADVTTAPYSLTVPNVAAGDYLIYAAVAAADGITVLSQSARIIVGNLPNKVLFVTADPGPLTFAGDIAVLAHLQGRGINPDLSTGTALPSDGSAAQGYGLVIVSSSLGSGTVADKLRKAPVPVMEWEQAIQDDFLFQADDATHGSTVSMTDINIVDAASPLAAGLTAGTHTVLSAPETMSWGGPLGQPHIVATMTDDPTHANLYYYEKGATGYTGFVMPARRVFFFFENDTARSANADAWKLFDAAVDFLRPAVVAVPTLTVKSNADGSFTLTYTGTLVESDTANGTYTPVSGATSPFNVNPKATGAKTSQFFKARQ